MKYNPPKPATPIEEPRELARVLADVLEARPSLLARTSWATGLTASGSRIEAESPEAVRFCAIGVIERCGATGVATSLCCDRLIDLLAEKTGVGSLGSWFEGNTAYLTAEERRHVPRAQPTERYLEMLREVAAG